MNESSSQQPIRDYKDLHVWQKGMQLAKEIYLLTGKLPSEEKFGLISQMRRAAVSIPSNIAEGQARNTTGEFVQFISPCGRFSCGSRHSASALNRARLLLCQ